MALRSIEIVQLRKKAYGLSDEPKDWFDEVTRRPTNPGWIAMTLERTRREKLCASPVPAAMTWLSE